MRQTIGRFRALLFFSGAFNIVLAMPLILPTRYAAYFRLLSGINQFLGLGGGDLVPAEDGIHALLINTAGIDLVLIGAVVFYSGFDPIGRRFIPLANAVGRTLFALLVMYYVVTTNIARLVVVIAGIDVVISVGFAYFLIKLRRVQSLEPAPAVS